MSRGLRTAAVIVGAAAAIASGVGAAAGVGLIGTAGVGAGSSAAIMAGAASFAGIAGVVSAGLSYAAGFTAKKPSPSGTGSPEAFTADLGAHIPYTIGRAMQAARLVSSGAAP